jgi:hypothetical protein
VTPDTVIDGQLDTQGWNRYMYCRGNPIRYNDPTGHDWRDKVLSGAQSVGEGIRNVGEKITQPLRDAGNALRDKLDGNLQNKANGTGSRLSGSDIKQQMLSNFNPKTNSTTFGNTKVTFSGIADPKKAISGLNDKTLSVLGDITSKNKITDMTLTSAARTPIGDPARDPHRFKDSNPPNPGGGRGLDITYMKSADGKDALFQDKNYNTPRSESSLAKDITRDFQEHKDVKQVFTPWQMKNSPASDPTPNTWREKAGQTPKSNDEWHNNHLHVGI